MTEYVLVGCVKSKRDIDHTARAERLYTSPLFRKRRAFATARGDRWGILSAEHGYLHPAERIEPYNTHISDVDPDEWRDRVLADLRPRLKRDRVKTVTILAGRDYVDPLEPALERDGYDVLDFNRGRGIGDRLSHLNEHLRTATNQSLGEYSND